MVFIPIKLFIHPFIHTTRTWFDDRLLTCTVLTTGYTLYTEPDTTWHEVVGNITLCCIAPSSQNYIVSLK